MCRIHLAEVQAKTPIHVKMYLPVSLLDSLTNNDRSLDKLRANHIVRMNST